MRDLVEEFIRLSRSAGDYPDLLELYDTALFADTGEEIDSCIKGIVEILEGN